MNAYDELADWLRDMGSAGITLLKWGGGFILFCALLAAALTPL